MDRLTADLRVLSSFTPVAKTHLRPGRGELGKRLQPSCCCSRAAETKLHASHNGTERRDGLAAIVCYWYNNIL